MKYIIEVNCGEGRSDNWEPVDLPLTDTNIDYTIAKEGVFGGSYNLFVEEANIDNAANA